MQLTLLLLARCGIGRRDHHKRGKGHGLVDPSLLLIQPIYHRYARRGMILDEDKEFVDYRWVIDRIDRRGLFVPLSLFCLCLRPNRWPSG